MLKMLVKIFSFFLGLITYPITKRIFELTLKSAEINQSAVMIVFLVIFSLMALGIYFILRKIFGFLFFLGLIIGMIISLRLF